MKTAKGKYIAVAMIALTPVLLPQTPAQCFQSTAPMSTARYRPTATLLTNGLVLLAGGYAGGSSSTTNAELFNPVTGTWTNTGSMHMARQYHTATLLPNGQVLVAGGSTNNYDVGGATAELYDPITGTWTLTGPMKAPHTGNTATLLPNGKVLVAGAVGASMFQLSNPTNNCELFDPATGTWANTGNLKSDRWEHTATLLPDGRVLVAGGTDPANGSSQTKISAELYDPATGTWTNTAPLPSPHWLHSATLLSNGKVLLAGSVFVDTNGTYRSSNYADLYDPVAGTWTNTGFMNTARCRHTATLLPNGQVLITGGSFNGVYNAQRSAELYDPLTATWKNAAAAMNMPRYHHRATLLPDGRVLIAGGSGSCCGNVTNLSSAELYVPFTLNVVSSNAWTATNGSQLQADGIYASNSVVLYASASLTNWQPILTNGPATGSVQFLDMEATNWLKRFYKASQR